MRHIEAMRKSGTNYVPLLLFPLLSVLRLVVAVRTLCRRHRFAFTHIDGVDDIALRIHDLIRTGLGTGITAIQSHIVTSDTAILCSGRKIMQRGEIFYTMTPAAYSEMQVTARSARYRLNHL